MKFKDIKYLELCRIHNKLSWNCKVHLKQLNIKYFKLFKKHYKLSLNCKVHLKQINIKFKDNVDTKYLQLFKDHYKLGLICKTHLVQVSFNEMSRKSVTKNTKFKAKNILQQKNFNCKVDSLLDKSTYMLDKTKVVLNNIPINNKGERKVFSDQTNLVMPKRDLQKVKIYSPEKSIAIKKLTNNKMRSRRIANESPTKYFINKDVSIAHDTKLSRNVSGTANSCNKKSVSHSKNDATKSDKVKNNNKLSINVNQEDEFINKINNNSQKGGDAQNSKLKRSGTTEINNIDKPPVQENILKLESKKPKNMRNKVVKTLDSKENFRNSNVISGNKVTGTLSRIRNVSSKIPLQNADRIISENTSKRKTNQNNLKNQTKKLMDECGNKNDNIITKANEKIIKIDKSNRNKIVELSEKTNINCKIIGNIDTSPIKPKTITRNKIETIINKNNESKQQIEDKVKNQNVKNNSEHKDIADKNIKKNIKSKKVCFCEENTVSNKIKVSPKKYLRKRKTQNYAELSFTTSPIKIKTKNNIHIPIYKQNKAIDSQDHEQKDIYKFDFVPEKNDSDSECQYDKEMKNIMTKIKEKVDKKPKKRQRRKKVANQKIPEKSVKEKGRDMIQRVWKKIENKKSLKNTETNVNKRNNKELCKLENIYVEKKNIEQNNIGIVKVHVPIYNDHEQHITNISDKLKCDTLVVSNASIEIPEKSIIIAEDHEIDQFDNENFSDGDQIDDDIHNDFGFESENEVQVLSHIVIPKKKNNLNISKASFPNIHRPGANSTMLCNPLNDLSPWRPNFVSRRRPLFLTTKKSNLPSYEQDMVINSTMVTSSRNPSKTINEEENVTNIEKQVLKKTPIIKHVKKQSSILNYVNASIAVEENSPENMDCSLFDEHGLSPIKNIGNKLLKNNQITPHKRIILGEHHQNTLSHIESTPIVRPATNIQMSIIPDESDIESDGVENYFGFNSPIQNKQKKPIIRINNKPSRISLGDIKVLRNKKSKIIDKDKDKNQEQNVAENIEMIKDVKSFPSPTSQKDHTVRIFEDLEVTFSQPPQKSYRPKRTRRRPLNINNVSDDEIEEEEVPKQISKKKKKDVWTIQEKIQVDKWAADFNSMCEDIDQYNLEIE